MTTTTAATDERFSLKRVRRNCLECSGHSPKYVMYCPCDGKHSTSCEFWLFRFGIQPKTFRARWGGRLLDPEQMPPADINLDDLPADTTTAATGLIDVPDYRMPAVHVERTKTRQSPELTEEERKAIRERLQRGRRKPR